MSVTPTKKWLAPGFALSFSLSLTQKIAASRQRSDQGLTLIEGLVAIVVVSITLVSITPPIFWATGTRVQNRRAEQALQLAQGEIDRVRTLVDQGQATIKLLPPVGADNIRVANSVPAPTSAKSGLVTVNPSCKTNPDNGESPALGEYIQINTDPNPENPNDCKPNFLMQTFRSTGLDGDGNPVTGSAIPEGFVMGVRVYSIVAEPNLIGSKAETTQASLKGTNGLGNQLTRPLAVQYSTIVRSNASKNLDLYRKLCPTAGAGQC
ncbi:type II secretion system protein [Phormidesmis priestleyi ULC007]|uniref:Type II secretion system protein n=1 Tax=Phormidesmis priestleyi ULC007 TaxID=1920490 RepID=A0A2T1DBT0_9CYAN|nr:type II secretion system protein [Phormidesmis priestleyi]PSB17982.1 type II secretion system protein [Phormidesmis priestleyi ULC007]PZO49322.1 MAG: type II secretion system protein [Phormidesmis priestleyi]